MLSLLHKHRLLRVFFCERAACPFENEWLVNDAIYQSAFNGGQLSEHAEGDANAKQIRSYLANHVSRVHMAHDS